MLSVSSEKFDTNECKTARQSSISYDPNYEKKAQHVHAWRVWVEIHQKITLEIVRELEYVIISSSQFFLFAAYSIVSNGIIMLMYRFYS